MREWAALRSDYPLWIFQTDGWWSASGPGGPPRTYVAERDGRRLFGRTIGELRAKLEAEPGAQTPRLTVVRE